MTRQAEPSIFTLDRALQQTQRELQSLQAQLSERSTSPTRQQGRGDNRGGFARTARGLYQCPISLKEEDFVIGQNGLHFAVRAVKSLELTEAWWYPHEDFPLPPVGYAFVRIHEAVDGQDPLAGRELGYISGESRAAGGTGALARGSAYRFGLSEQPRVESGQTVVINSEATNPAGAWPDGDVLLMWRYL